MDAAETGRTVRRLSALQPKNASATWRIPIAHSDASKESHLRESHDKLPREGCVTISPPHGPTKKSDSVLCDSTFVPQKVHKYVSKHVASNLATYGNVLPTRGTGAGNSACAAVNSTLYTWVWRCIPKAQHRTGQWAVQHGSLQCSTA